MNVVISAMAVVSSLGIGTGPFVAGWRAGRSAFTPTTDGPAPRAGRVTGLADDEDFAATKQVRLKERSSALAVGTVAKLLAAADLTGVPAARRGIVLGSALASIDTFMDISRDSLAGAKPYFVDHKRVPACAMNYTSSQAAIRFDLRGPNVTVTAGRATGLVALTYARRLVRAGRADAVLCGAFEEVTARRLRIEAAAGRLHHGTPPGEGCCVFLLEAAGSAARGGRAALAELLGCAAGVFTDPQGGGDALAATVARALNRAGVDAQDVRAVVRGTPGGGSLTNQEARVIAGLVPGVPVVDPAALVGDTYGASAAFGVAAAIVDADARHRAGVTLVTSIDPDGQVACGVLRPMR
jgi:3-oxoacyl-[acyl-carrier-protein] synthase II